MLHGEEILNSYLKIEKSPNNHLMSIIRRAMELNKKKIQWHHHLLFPDCIFNHHKKWNIVFEDPENGKKTETFYDSEPKDDLLEIEKLIYSQ